MKATQCPEEGGIEQTKRTWKRIVRLVDQRHLHTVKAHTHTHHRTEDGEVASQGTRVLERLVSPVSSLPKRVCELVVRSFFLSFIIQQDIVVALFPELKFSAGFSHVMFLFAGEHHT